MSLDFGAGPLPRNLSPRGDLSRRDAVVGLMVAAFAGDAAVRALYPGEDEYRRHFPDFLTAFGGKAFEAGTVDVDPLGRGAALWFPPGVAPDEAAIMDCLERTIPAERLDALAAGLAAQGALHPEEPHWYLPWIGVVPEAQGQGVGAALLRRRLRLADAQGLPCYLEATNRRNARLYARHGFEVLGIVEAPDYPEIVAMWRPVATEAVQ
jgi:ribosomal protein S18 acetylase RimI-like enzyme